MTCERSIFSMLLECWEKRIGSRLDMNLKAYDLVKEINSHLLPNDHLEALVAFWRKSVTSYRSLVWPFTPQSRFRFPTMGVYI